MYVYVSGGPMAVRKRVCDLISESVNCCAYPSEFPYQCSHDKEGYENECSQAQDDQDEIHELVMTVLCRVPLCDREGCWEVWRRKGGGDKKKNQFDQFV